MVVAVGTPRYRAAHCDRCPTLSPALANGAAIVDGYVGQIKCTIGHDYCVSRIYIRIAVPTPTETRAMAVDKCCTSYMLFKLTRFLASKRTSTPNIAAMLGAHEKRPAKIAGRSMLRVNAVSA